MNDEAPACLQVLIVDDQPLVRRGLAVILATEPGIEIVGQAANGLEAVEQALAVNPDIVLMDLQMPHTSGIVATRQIKAQRPAIRIVVLTSYDNDELVFGALCAGAQAYLLKDAPEAEILETLRAVQRDESHLSPSIARKVIEQFRVFASRPSHDNSDTVRMLSFAQTRPVSTPHSALLSALNPSTDVIEKLLTEKEQQILELLAQGKLNKQIAAAVFLTQGTVKNYIRRIMHKLHARSRIELAMWTVNRRN